jgi:hypothetical protein
MPIMTRSLNIRAQYFDFRPVAGHLPDCPRAGTDVWETTRYTWHSFDGETVRETTFRVACHDCGVVAFETFDGPPSGFQGTHASIVGYGSRPEKVCGLWLHPGPRLWDGDDHGPAAFYVTETRDRPRDLADMAGVVAWHMGPRGGTRWAAGLGQTSSGCVRESSGQDWPSRRPAVAWIAAQVTAAAAGRAA